MKIRPFREGDAFATLKNVVDKTVSEIKSLDNEYVLKASVSELEEFYINKVIIEPIQLHADQKYIDDRLGTKIDVSNDFDRIAFGDERIIVQGTQLDIAIPYEGDSGLFKLRPSTYGSGMIPDIEIEDDRILFSISFPDDKANGGALKIRIEQQAKLLSDNVQYLKTMVETHNKTAPNEVRQALQHKKKLAESSLGILKDLDIPIKRRDEPLTYAVPTKRRKLPINQPKVSTEKYQIEPRLDESEYQYILKIMRGMSLVIERTPNSFSNLDEEAIRDHFLIQLNGTYEGSATGETFNASGKTDILIRVRDRNIFIAECKFWRGPKEFDKAIDQLLSYLSWRDTKCALLIFNKTKDSTAVRGKMYATMESRPEHRKAVKHNLEGDSRYIFVKESDPGREIIISTQLYDIPQAS